MRINAPSRPTRAVPMYGRPPSGHTGSVTTFAPTICRTDQHQQARAVAVITVAGHLVQADALRQLLSMSPEIDVISAESDVVAARDAIIRTRPDVVVLECAHADLRRFRSVLDLQLAMPTLGFVIILTNHAGTTARQPPVDRAVLVLPAQFSFADLLAAVTSVAAPAWLDWDGTELLTPVAV